ncbi:MAG: hypothetical protein AB9866_18495 [Syntrophobacteraceae bacterium]
MKKRISPLFLFLLVLSVCGSVFGATKTSNLGLTVPAPREDWGNPLANDLRLIDQAFGKLAGQLSDLPGTYAYTGTFNGPEGTVINLPTAVSSISEYFVAVTPTSRTAEIGDISVDQGTSAFTVRCSKVNTADTFKAELSYIGDADSYGGSVYREWIASPNPASIDQAAASTPRSLAWMLARIGGAHASLRMPGNHIYQLRQNLVFASNISLRLDAGAIIKTWYSIRSVDYRWISTGAGTNEYRCESAAGGNPGILNPERLFINGAKAARGQAGSLAPGQWDYSSSGGFSTIIVRLPDGADPDTKAGDFVRVHYSLNHSGPVEGPIRQRYDCGLSTEDVLFGYSAEVSPEHWGAAGDDLTDDLAPVEAAIASLANHGGIFAPLGKTYRVSRGDGGIAVNNLVSNLKIRGVPGKTAFKNVRNNGSELYAVFTGINLANIEITGIKSKGAALALFKSCADVRVENCFLDGQYAANDRADKSITFYGCSRVRVLNNYFENINYGTYIGHATQGTTDDVVVSGNTFKNTELSSDSIYPAAVYVYHGKAVVISKNNFSDILPYDNATVGYGVYEGDGSCDSLIASDNVVYHTHESVYSFVGLSANAARSINFHHNQFNFTGGVAPIAIKHGANNVTGPSQILIDANQITYSTPTATGIWVAHVPPHQVRTTISRNEVYNSGIYAAVNSNQWIKITDNTIIGSAANGIILVDPFPSLYGAQCYSPEISHNNIHNAAYSGIFLSTVRSANVLSNIIYDCNISNSSNEDKASGIIFSSYSYGGIITSNIIRNSNAGKLRYGVNFFDSTQMYKFLYYGNSIEGMLIGDFRY